MAFIKPSKVFEGSGVGPLDILKDKIEQISWRELQHDKQALRNTVMALLTTAGKTGASKAEAIDIIKTAAARAGANYQAKFYTRFYNRGRSL